MSREGIKRRGFASMSAERRKQIASKGGKSSQSRGTGHRFTSESGKRAQQSGLLTRRRGRQP